MKRSVSELESNPIKKSANVIKYELFSAFSIRRLKVNERPTDYYPENVIMKALTKIVRYIIVSFVKDTHFNTNEQNAYSTTFFWNKINSPTEINKEYVEGLFNKTFGEDSERVIECMTNENCDTIKGKIDDFFVLGNKNKFPVKKVPRFCFHYISDGRFGGKLMFNTIIPSLMAKISVPGLHVFDCDNSGTIFKHYYSQSFGSDINICAMFSCSEGEKNPRSSDLPADTFTSCLNSPGKMILLWHSLHYYCFKDGPMRPIKLDELGNIPYDLIVNLDTLLKAFVEGMVCNKLNPNEFIKLFHSDDVMGRYYCGFIVAQKIFSFFDVHPISFPSIPNFSDDRHWELFSLQLDQVLYAYHEKMTFSYESILKYDISSIKIHLESDIEIEYYTPYLGIMNIILRSEHYLDGCKFIAKLMDKSLDAIRQTWLFPLIDPLVSISLRREKDPYFILAVTKSIVYAPQCRSNFSELFTTDTINTYMIELLRATNTRFFSLVIITCFLHYFDGIDSDKLHRTRVKIFLASNWVEIWNICKLDKNTDIKNWLLLLLSNIINFLGDQKFTENVYDFIVDAILNETYPETRCAAIYSLIPYIYIGYGERIFDFFSKLEAENNFNIRLQVINLLMAIVKYDKDRNVQNKARNLIGEMKMDPFNNVNRYAYDFLAGTTEYKKSYVFESFCSQFLGRCSDICEHPKLTLRELTEHRVDRLDYIDRPNTQKKFYINIGKPKPTSNISFTSKHIFYAHDYYLFMQQKDKINRIDFTNNSLNYITVVNPELVLITDNNGQMNVLSINEESTIGVVTSFNCTKDRTSNLPVYFDVSSYSHDLLVWDDKVYYYDLVTEKYKNTIRRSNPIICSRLNPYFPYIFTVTDDEGVSVYDTRASYEATVFDIKNKNLFEAFPLGDDIILVEKNCKIHKTGLLHRREEEIRICSEGDEVTSFACLPGSSNIFLGTNRGLYHLDIKDFSSRETVMYQSSSKLVKSKPIKSIALGFKNDVAFLIEDSQIVVIGSDIF